MFLWTLPETERPTTTQRGALMPPADVIDDGDHYRLILEMPGVAQDAVTLDLEGGTLTVRGERTAHPENARLLYNGRFAARPFEKRFTIGEDIDRAHVSAVLHNGLLEITLPRKAEEKARRIAVEVNP